LEIIVVDDASRDNTRDVVLAVRDNRIRYIRHESNRGGSAARNTGIRAATGDYISFLDDDDEWEPEKTKEQMKVLQNFDAVLCTSNEPGSGSSRHDTKQAIELDDLRRGNFTAGGTGVLMAKALVLKETMFDESLPRYQDWDLFIRIAQRFTIGYLNHPLVRYNEGAHERISNKIANMPAPLLEKQVRMLQKHRDFFGARWYRRHMCTALLYSIKHRQDKIAHLAYTVRRYGFINVVRVLSMRIGEKVRSLWRVATAVEGESVRRSGT